MFSVNLKKKIKTITVEGHRKSVPSVMYTKDFHDNLPKAHHASSKLEEIETMYIETESEAHKRYQRQ